MNSFLLKIHLSLIFTDVGKVPCFLKIEKQLRWAIKKGGGEENLDCTITHKDKQEPLFV